MITSRQLRKRQFKDAAYRHLSRIGKALASPKRLELLDLLCQTDRTVEQLAEHAEMSVANASQHLQLLEAAQLLRGRKQGRFVILSLADSLVCDFFRSYRMLAEERLAEMERIRQLFLDDPNELYPVDAETLMGRMKIGKVVVIDVRPEEEYRFGHIRGALGIPLQKLKWRLAKLPRRKDIVAYCRGPYCMLAADAVRMLRSRGLRAFRLDLSIHDWSALGFPLATGAEASSKAFMGMRSQ